MEENVRVERFRTTNEQLPEDTRESSKVWKSNVNEKSQKFPFPTYHSVKKKPFPGAEAEQAFKRSGSSKPDFARMNEDKQRYAAPVEESLWDLSDSDGKCSPDWDLEETPNTRDELKKGNVALDELSSRSVENTTAVLDGHNVGSKALHDMDQTSTEKVYYRGAFGNTMKAEDGAGEPAAKETSKKKKKKKKSQSPNFYWKKAPSRIDAMNARPAAYSGASYRKPAGENSYPRGIIPMSQQFFTKNVRPANENYNSRGFKPTNEHSLGRGVQSANENYNTRDIRPTNGQSLGRGVRSANENYNTRDVRPTTGQSFGRGVPSASENCNARDVRPTNGQSYGRGVPSASENYNTQGIKPASERSFGRGVRITGGNSCAWGVKSSSEHSIANSFRPACESTFVQSRENSYPGGYRPASGHSSAIGENTYGRSFRSENELPSAKAICPTSEISYGQSFRPQSDQSHAKGFHPTSENSCQRGFRSTSGHPVVKGNCSASQNPYERGLRPASENSLAKRFSPRSDNSHNRDFKPSNEQQSFSKGVHQVRETSHAMIFRPTRENSLAKAFGPPGVNKCFTTGNSFPKDHQPASINMSGERKVSFSGISIARRGERVLYPIASQETRQIGMHHSVLGSNVMPRLRRLNTTTTTTSCNRFGSSGSVSTTYHHVGTRKVAVVKPRPKEEIEPFPRKVLGPPTELDFIERVLSTDNMFSSRSGGKQTKPGWKKHMNQGAGGMNFQSGVSKEWPRKGMGVFSREGSADSLRGFKGGCQQWSTAEQHPDVSRGPDGREESDEMEPPLQLKYVNWVRKEDIGHFFVSGLANVDPHGHGESGGHSQPNFLTFDDLVLLDGLETVVVSITDSIDADNVKGFVARFPASCSLHLLVNEVDKIYSEYITVCCSCPNLIVDHKVGSDKNCPRCRVVHLITYPDMNIKCQFMLLRSSRMLRFVLLSSSLSICDWDNRIQFGWFHDFSAVQEEKSICVIPSEVQKSSSSPFSNDLTEFLASLQISDLNVLSGLDFSNVSPAIRLIHTKPGVSCTNDPTKYGARQLQQIIRNLAWRSQKKKQSIYKTERLDERGYSILNDVFPNTLSGELQTSAKHVKVVYPSIRWINECLANSESSPDRLSLLSTVNDISSLEEFPWNFLNNMCEKKDFVHNYNVLEQYENWDHAGKTGKTKRYGWFLTGSQALDTDSWGEDYPVYHKVIYKHFQLSVGLFPYLRRNENSKKVEVCSVDLFDVPLPFDPTGLVPYRRDDMPRLVLDSGQNVFCHCAGVFSRSKRNFGFIVKSPLLKGYLDPFPAPSPGQLRHDIFLHLSCLSQPELPPEGSVIEFFFLNQPAIQGRDLVRVCAVFHSIEEAIGRFLAARTPAELAKAHKEMVMAKALSLGLECVDDVKQMEDAIEDYYNVFFSSQRRGFSYFPTQQQIDAISIEPVKILSDAEWVRNYYKDRRNHASLPLNIAGCRPSELLASFHAMKYRFVKELREVEKRNKQLGEENQDYVLQNWDCEF